MYYMEVNIRRAIELYFRENGYYPNLIILTYNMETENLNNGRYRIVYETKTKCDYENYSAIMEEYYVEAKVKVVYDIDKVLCMREVENNDK